MFDWQTECTFFIGKRIARGDLSYGKKAGMTNISLQCNGVACQRANGIATHEKLLIYSQPVSISQVK